MVSRNWFAVLLAGCLTFAVSVATVQPSNAVEFGNDVAVNEPQDGLSAQSGSFAVLRRYEQIDESVVNFLEIGLLNIGGVGTFSSIGRFLGTWGTD